MTIKEQITAVQKELGITADGVPGVATWAAIFNDIVGLNKSDETQIQTPDNVPHADDRSEKAILTLLPQVQPYARSLVHDAADQGITIIVTSGTRTYDEQNDLYEQGRTKPGRIVTNAHAGYSNHNFGVAFDVTIFSNGKPVWESPNYKAVGVLGKKLGLTWGGDWISINDEPHFEFHPQWAKDMSEKEMLEELRRRHADNQPVFV